MPTHSKGDNRTKTVSLPGTMLSDVQDRMAELGMKNFSAYSQLLYKNDLARRGDLILRANVATDGEARPERKSSRTKRKR